MNNAKRKLDAVEKYLREKEIEFSPILEQNVTISDTVCIQNIGKLCIIREILHMIKTDSEPKDQ